MLNRMTVRAQHFKIADLVVFSVAVFMVHAKYFWHFVVPASCARSQHPSYRHLFTYGGKRRLPLLFGGFVNARFRAVFSFVRRRAQKFDAAMRATVLHSAFSVHGFVVALRRTVFSLVGAARNVAKRCSAFFAHRRDLHSGRQRKTLSAAIQRGVFAVRRHRKHSATLLANFFVPNAGACYAFSQVGLQRSV